MVKRKKNIKGQVKWIRDNLIKSNTQQELFQKKMRFITLTAAIAALLAVATVQAAPAGQQGQDANKQASGDNTSSATVAATSPISLTTDQLNQCVTQIVDKSAKVCDLTQLDGLTIPTNNNDVQLKIDNHILDLNALTTLVTKAKSNLNNKGETVNADSVQKAVTGLVQDLPSGQVDASSLNKRSSNDNSNTDQILADSGLSLDEVKSLVGKALTDLNVNPPVAKNLSSKVKKSICETLTKHHIECDKILPILAKEGRLA